MAEQRGDLPSSLPGRALDTPVRTATSTAQVHSESWIRPRRSSRRRQVGSSLAPHHWYSAVVGHPSGWTC
jgi:hypothetical protein